MKYAKSMAVEAKLKPRRGEAPEVEQGALPGRRERCSRAQRVGVLETASSNPARSATTATRMTGTPAATTGC